MQGYEGSFLKLISSKPGKHPQPIAFVSFKLRKQAEKALNELQVSNFKNYYTECTQSFSLFFCSEESEIGPCYIEVTIRL